MMKIIENGTVKKVGFFFLYPENDKCLWSNFGLYPLVRP